MSQYQHIVYQPLFFLFIGFSFLLTLGYFWGQRKNKKIVWSAFDDLKQIIRPDDQTFTNIGGQIGWHANFLVTKKGAPVSKVDATITLLPRHSWLYMPISKITRRYDRLFITLHLRKSPSEETHLIENGYNGFKGSKITNAQNLNREDIMWGKLKFSIYFQSISMRDAMIKFAADNPDPGTIRHIALVPEQKKSFVFMIPKPHSVAVYLKPVYRWLPSLVKQSRRP